jgi:hypothetical protein
MKRRNQMKKMAIPTPSSREVDMTYNVTTTLVFLKATYGSSTLEFQKVPIGHSKWSYFSPYVCGFAPTGDENEFVFSTVE